MLARRWRWAVTGGIECVIVPSVSDLYLHIFLLASWERIRLYGTVLARYGRKRHLKIRKLVSLVYRYMYDFSGPLQI